VISGTTHRDRSEATSGIGSLRVQASPHNRSGSSFSVLLFHFMADSACGNVGISRPVRDFQDPVETVLWFPRGRHFHSRLRRSPLRDRHLRGCSTLVSVPIIVSSASYAVVFDPPHPPVASFSRRRTVSASAAPCVARVRRAQSDAHDGPRDPGSRRRPWGRPSSRATARAAVDS
jgi:hypothetical protein